MLKLKVADMSCGHCAASVEKAVKSVDPQASVAVDLRGGTVAVTSGAEPGRIRTAIEQAGYPNELLAA